MYPNGGGIPLDLRDSVSITEVVNPKDNYSFLSKVCINCESSYPNY